ncbi:MAG: hypothetical protein LBQ95_06400 [Lachnospiraceae bacterium]|jgi:hypothetical protein|nr:hypothetical protein [Lachnospiraceae bacterium]
MQNPFKRSGNMYADPGRKSFQNRAYHKYFEGYSETKVADKNGKMHIKRVYTGTYYSQNISAKTRNVLRSLIILLFLLSAFMFIFSASRRNNANITIYATALQALSLIIYLRLLYVLIRYIAAPIKMDIGTFNATSAPLINASRFTAISQLLLFCASAYHAFFAADSDIKRELLCAGGFLLAGALAFGVSLIENRIKYNRTQSETKTIEDGVEISR